MNEKIKVIIRALKMATDLDPAAEHVYGVPIEDVAQIILTAIQRDSARAMANTDGTIAIAIYHEGDGAFAGGVPRTANPYPNPGDDSACPWAWWDLGWQQASVDPRGPLPSDAGHPVH